MNHTITRLIFTQENIFLCDKIHRALYLYLDNLDLVPVVIFFNTLTPVNPFWKCLLFNSAQLCDQHGSSLWKLGQGQAHYHLQYFPL